ncbi:MAG TPA: glycosyltransferase family 9 protein [Blastocatellia bacterium]|nr:glycosyltransferase family 9 protein [Blastocatellia bacterium]
MRILIVKLSSIGDVAHAMPAAALLRRALPDARISWVVERRASAILKGSSAIDDLIELDSRAWRKNIFQSATITDVRAKLKQVRGLDNLNGDSGETRADIAIDFQGLIKSGIVARASRAAARIGFETADLREKLSRVFLTEQAPTVAFSHVIEKNLALARAAIARAGKAPEPFANLSPRDYEFPVTVAPEDESYVENAIGRTNSRFAIINPGGGWATKLWPAEAYAKLADWLWIEYGMASFITYGPGEEQLAQSVASNCKSGAARLIDTTLKQFVALARRASLFIGGDTGPLHLAAASRTPIVGIYGPTSPERNGPFDQRDLVVGRNLWCRAECHRRSCWHWECMDIPVSAVMQAVSTRLANTVEDVRVRW